MRIFLCVGDWTNQPKSLDAVKAKNRLYAFSNLWDIPFTKSNMLEILKALLRVKGNGEKLMIDSGVAVLNNRYFQSDIVQRRGRIPFSQTDLETLVDKYVLLLRAAVKIGAVDIAMEMDADHFVGYSRVKEYRKRLIDTGAKVIPVWRPTLGRDAFYELTELYDWVALSEGIAGISVNTRRTLKFFCKIVAEGVQRKGQKFHFFAGLRRTLLFGSPLYSADSTTWSAFSRWALTTRFDPKSMWIDWGIAAYGVESYDSREQIGVEDIPFNPKSQLYVDAIAARSYSRLERYVTEFWRQKGVVFND